MMRAATTTLAWVEEPEVVSAVAEPPIRIGDGGGNIQFMK